MEVPRGWVRAPGGAYELYREFRTSRRALNVLSVRAGLPEQESSYAPPGARTHPRGTTLKQKLSQDKVRGQWRFIPRISKKLKIHYKFALTLGN